MKMNLSSQQQQNVVDGKFHREQHESDPLLPQCCVDDSWPRSYNDHRHRHSLLRYYNQFVASSQQKEWQCVSPMTQHNIIIPQDIHPSPLDGHPSTATTRTTTRIRMRKHRSRSFNDYMDGLDKANNQALTLPPLRPTTGCDHHYEQQQNQIHYQHHQTPFPMDDEQDQIRRLVSSSSSSRINYDTSSRSLNEEMELLVSPSQYQHCQNLNSTVVLQNNGTFNSNNNQHNMMIDGSPPMAKTPSMTAPLTITTTKEEVSNSNDQDGNPIYISILYGAINCTIVIPVVMSFGNIIYRDNALAPYMPVLIKLTLVSGLVHQVCFSTFSSLRFAVGSVQDAGLIFLSTMVADMIAYCQQHHNVPGNEDNYDANEVMLATVTVGLGVATALLGIGLFIIGKLGLAHYVQMLPTCVVAGYLAYIGWFVGYSGLGIMVGGGRGGEGTNPWTGPILIDNILHVLPGLAGGIFIYTSVQRYKHVAVLPICIMIILLTFYLGLIITGSSIEEATENGWIRPSEKAPVWYHTWDYLKLDKVAWGALPPLWLTWSGMLFVVALSSSLDVAAIELEMKQPLNYNKELCMVGISNFVSGMTGGYTGSYIFSQSIFSLRIGIRSRLAGFALAFFQLVIILVPFPVFSYIPNFFYGSLLSMICMDLMYEWLWEFRSKVTTPEYVIALSTFVWIHLFGVEYGILGGVAIYVLCRQLHINVGEWKQIPTRDDEEVVAAATAT